MKKFVAILRAQLNKISKLFRGGSGAQTKPPAVAAAVPAALPLSPTTSEDVWPKVQVAPDVSAMLQKLEDWRPAQRSLGAVVVGLDNSASVQPVAVEQPRLEPAVTVQPSSTDAVPACLPPPLTPPEANLTRFHFLPIEGATFTKLEDWIRCKQDHKLAFPTLSLMLASWHSTPAGSLANKDMILRDAAGLDTTQWAAVKDQVMAGWVLCSDHRWYHPYVASKVLTAWNGKLDRAYETECKRVAKWNERHPGAKEREPTYEEWIASGAPTGRRSRRTKNVAATEQRRPIDNSPKGKGDGQGEQYFNGQGIRGAAEVPFDLQEAWPIAMKILTASGMEPAQAELKLSKLRMAHPEVLAAAIYRTAKEKRESPGTYLATTCTKMAKDRAAAPAQMSLPETDRETVPTHPETTSSPPAGMQSMSNIMTRIDALKARNGKP